MERKYTMLAAHELNGGRLLYDLMKMEEIGDVLVPSFFVLEMWGTERQPKLRLEAELRNGVMECTSVELTAKPAAPITGVDLKSVLVERWIDQAMKLLSVDVVKDEETGVSTATWGDKDLSVTGRRAVEKIAVENGRRGLPDDHYEKVAAAFVEGGEKVQAVADALDVPFSTAARWVRTAKKRGFIKDAK